MGYKFYSQKGTKHYELLGIGQYNIGIHRGLFLMEIGKVVDKSNENKRDLYLLYIYDIKIPQIGVCCTTV